MFGLGMGELIVIFVVALLVLGPKKLPELATGLGKAIRQFRQATRDLQDQIEIDDTVRRPIQELKAALRDEPPPVAMPPLSMVAAPHAGATDIAHEKEPAAPGSPATDVLAAASPGADVLADAGSTAPAGSALTAAPDATLAAAGAAGPMSPAPAAATTVEKNRPV